MTLVGSFILCHRPPLSSRLPCEVGSHHHENARRNDRVPTPEEALDA
jgi:hypothetical protein